MNDMKDQEYKEYLEKLDLHALKDVAKHIDREKYPEKWEIIKEALNQRKTTRKETESTPNNPDTISRLWKGDIPLVKTFWLFWFLPSVISPIAIKLIILLLAFIFGSFIVPILYLTLFLFSIYQVICIKGIWSSANKYYGKKIWPILAKGFIVFNLAIFVYSTYSQLTAPDNDTHDPNRTAEKLAVPSEKYPLAGFYKEEPGNNFGFAIGPNEDGTYFISFCGPGGCFKPGTYRPNTTIIDDPNYEIVDENTLKFKQILGGTTVKRYPKYKQ